LVCRGVEGVDPVSRGLPIPQSTAERLRASPAQFSRSHHLLPLLLSTPCDFLLVFAAALCYCLRCCGCCSCCLATREHQSLLTAGSTTHQSQSKTHTHTHTHTPSARCQSLANCSSSGLLSYLLTCRLIVGRYRLIDCAEKVFTTQSTDKIGHFRDALNSEHLVSWLV